MKVSLLLLVSFVHLFAQPKIKEEWLTQFERSNYLSTSNYAESIQYFNKLSDNSEFAKLITIGISPQGRELKCLIVSKDKIFDPVKAKKSDNAILLINNGIHSGEIEGKDASMLILREMLVSGESSKLLDNVILLVIPVFNLDGHERSSKYNRINQNGPTEMGWRTTAQNINLNRDFTKADSPEMKSLLKLFSDWLPDIFIDNHTTDGADYQYTITYGITSHQNVAPATRELVNNNLIPFFTKGVEDKGFLIAPYAGSVDGDYKNGIRNWVPSPRFSNGYAAAQNRIGLLVETHMLKPYKDRVFSTKALLESVIRYCGINHLQIKEISRNADEFAIDNYYLNKKALPLRYTPTKNSVDFIFKGFQKEIINRKIAGKDIVRYTNKKVDLKIPYFNEAKITDSVFLPRAYIIPSEWSSLIEILNLHGIHSEKNTNNKIAVVEKYKFKNVKFANWSYEGRFSPSFDYDVILDTVQINPGDYIISTNQRSIGMIAHLLEPKASDSFVKWGFMNIIFERKEYFEEYSMEPIAQEMYNKSAELRNEFDALVATDTTFAKNPRARLNFFYERSPYYDKKYDVYPIMRVID